MGRTYLATTGSHDIWAKDGDIVFLGSWCLNDKNRSCLGGRNAAFVPDPAYSTGNLLRNAEYCENVYSVILNELAGSLNKLHEVDKGADYWSTILNPWLIYYINIAHERYSRVQNALRAGYPSLYTHSLEFDADFAPSDSFEFISDKVGDDRYNLQLISQIALASGIECIKTDGKDLCRKEQSSGGLSAKGRLKELPKKILTGAQNIFLKESRLVMADMYHLNFWDYMRLSIGLKAAVSVEHLFPSWKRENFAYDPGMRSKLEFDGKGTDPFVDFLKNSIKYAIPRCYVEGYAEIRGYVRSIKRVPPKEIMSATGWHLNDRLKFYAAEMKEHGTRLVSMQHGGNYGFTRYHSTFVFELKNKDRFLSWGWGDGEEDGKIAVFPNPRLSKIKNKARGGGKYAVFISVNCPQYFFALVSYPGPEGMEVYFRQQFDFIKMIAGKFGEKLYYRPHRGDFGRNILPRLRSAAPLAKWAEKGDNYDLMKNARLVIFDYPGTSFVEALAMNVPLVLFCDFNAWPIKDSSKKDFDMLAKAGIVHDTPDAAAKKVLEVFDSAASWWAGSAVQQARTAFLNKYGHSSDDWRGAWLKKLREER